MKKYNPKSIESKWQRYWLTKKTFVSKNDSKRPKKFVMIEFPYPSGAGLHMGHMRPFVAGDVVSKYYNLKGFNTMYPVGWDAFGLPAENYAIKNKVHPSVSTKQNVKNAKRQLQEWGTGFDWSREINTTDPEYYKWTQKIFLEFFKKGLAYEKFGEINWCPKDKTGLANEEVIDGKCERCGTEVEKKNLRQWYLKITDYAEKLLEGLKGEQAKYFELTGAGTPRLDVETLERRIVDAIIENQKGEFLILKETDNGVESFHFVGGGTDGEKDEIALCREVAEESGYTDIKIIKTVCHVDSFGYRIPKKKNQRTSGPCFHVKLTSENKVECEVDKGVHEILWVKKENVAQILTLEHHKHMWERFLAAEKLDINAELAGLPEWPEHVKLQQENWIGKKTGINIEYGIEGLNEKVVCFTTRPDTNFGATFIVLGPEHPLLANQNILNIKPEIWEEIEVYKQKSIVTTDQDRTAENRKKSGVFTGLYCINTLNNYRMPLYVADYVLGNIGTGAVIGVPGHDKRDFEFSEVFKIPVLRVVQKDAGDTAHITSIDQVQEEEGVMVNSGFLDGMNIHDAMERIMDYMEEKGYGKRVVNYKLRDWVFSRQRYWGEPIPLIHCPKCGIVAVPEKDLPVKLPNVKKYEPTGTGESPLAAIESWVRTPCPQCIEDSKKTKYLVFDFDGVIGDTYKAGLQARIDCGWVKDVEESKKYCFDYFSKRPHHARGHSLSAKEVKNLLDESLVYGESVKKTGFKLFDLFIAEIKKVKNAKIAIVSSGSRIYAEIGVKKSKLKVERLLTCEDSFSKEEKLENVAKMWKVNLSDLYYFTDANSDVYELEHLLDRKKIIGCSWGYLGYDELRKTLPELQVLKKPKDIHNLFRPQIGRRETNTMPQWAGSSWYWLRYMDPHNKHQFSSTKSQSYWSPVDLYFGGMEHTTLHLLYSRFWNLFLYDQGLVTVKEPYRKRVPHGIILGPDGEKMSKSRGNVVNPDELIKIYGADTVRLYMMFLGPHAAQVSWNDKGIVGARRFLERVFSMSEFVAENEHIDVTKMLHKTIKKVQDDLETFSFNTAVSAMMIFVNKVYEMKSITKNALLQFIHLLAPMAPHITEEMWQKEGNNKSIFVSNWPSYDSKMLIDDEMNIVVQINGKVRAEIQLPSGSDEAEVVKMARADDRVLKFLEGNEPKKAIYIKGKLVNLVI